ncbi:gag-pol polyprotein [Tanacetum coccineum]
MLIILQKSTEELGTQVVHQTEIKCYRCKEFGHVARECHKPKQAKDSAYHKEKMLMYKQEEVVIQLSVEQVDWRDDTDDEPEDKEFEAPCTWQRFKKHHPEQPESVNDTYLVEQGDTNVIHDSSNMSNNGEEADQDDQMLKKNVNCLFL